MTRAMATTLVLEEGHKDLHQDDLGGEPWVLTVRKGHCRFGAHAFPLPGVGSFVSPASAGCFLLVLECEPILKQGITLPDAMAFFESENGVAHLGSGSVKLVALQQGRRCWVPFGWIAIPLGWSPGEDIEMSMVVHSYLHQPWWKELPPNVRAAVVELNQRHLKKVRTQAVWADRASLFERLFDAAT